MSQTKRIAAVTMVRDDDFYLRKWVEYYGRELGKENLYVLFDGTDQTVPDFCKGVNVTLREHEALGRAGGDKRRIAILSDLQNELLGRYDIVVGTDADEYIAVDPARGLSLREYLSQARFSACLSPLGIDVGQMAGKEDDIDPSRPFLSQRRYGVLCTRYTKASIVARPVRWGSGFHRVKGRNLHIAKDLYLFHCGYFDLGLIRERFACGARAGEGWQAHLQRRARTINTVSTRKVRSWRFWCPAARLMQSVIRPVYAWNKPAMLGLEIVVRIPDRFSDIF